MGEIEDLRARVNELEQQNATLASAAAADAPPVKKAGRGRAIVSAIVIVVAVLLAPVALIGSWAHTQLVDSDRFTETFAPLADEAAVQAFVSAQVSEAIAAQIDTDELVGSLFDGLRSLDLPPQANQALSFVEGPAAAGVQSLIDSAIEAVVTSDEFSDVWENTLHMTHENAIAVIQGDPEAALQLGDDGALSLQLSVLIEQVKGSMEGQFFGLVDMIPVVDQSIPLVQSDALALVRIVYFVAVSVGFWLPWVVLLLLVVGVLLARRRLRATTGAAVALAAVFAVFAALLGIGRVLVVSALSPSIMPYATSDAIYSHLTQQLLSLSIAFVVLMGLIAVMGWFAGSSSSARKLRSMVSRISGSARAGAAAHGVTTGRFGVFVERWRMPILVLVAVLGGLIVFLNRPVSVGGVVATVIGVIVVFAIVELVRRPDAEVTAAER